jgi:hypothetical protein
LAETEPRHLSRARLSHTLAVVVEVVEQVLSLTEGPEAAEAEAVLARVLMEPQISAAEAALDIQHHSLILRVETADRVL